MLRLFRLAGQVTLRLRFSCRLETRQWNSSVRSSLSQASTTSVPIFAPPFTATVQFLP